MGEAFITRRSGSGGAGGTIIVTGAAGSTVTATKGDKTYTRTLNSEGKATFKGLASGTWTITMTDGTQTVTKTVTITTDYNLTIAYFSATITITYPDASTCVVTDSAGTTVASDINGDSSAKTWTVTVGATGTYTITATNAAGSKSNSKNVSITADGQSESVELSYELILFDGQNAIGDITALTGGWASNMTDETTDTALSATKNVNGESTKIVYYYLRTENKIQLTEFSSLSANILSSNSGDEYSPRLGISEDGKTAVAYTKLNNATGTKALDISSYTGEYYIGFFYAFKLYGVYNLSISTDLVQLIP